VPQTIYITDDTIQRNIALGIPDNKIDIDRIMNAIELAQLTGFVKSLPNGIETIMGEHGGRISAGQRQRIGIARALYHQPDLLILDEATSALDAITERDVTETFENLRGEKTLLAIAHRLHTLKNCDRLFFLHEGRLVDVGTFSELLKRNESFRKTVELGQL
jgi:ATP-binding cassette subfamily C protein